MKLFPRPTIIAHLFSVLMELEISSMGMYVNPPATTSHHYHQPRLRVIVELERRSLYITPKEGQEA
jgi:hypothetical protein